MKSMMLAGLLLMAAGNAYAADAPSLQKVINDAQANGAMVSTITPVFSQLIKFPFPAGFHAITDKANGGFYILELVPQQESGNAWTQMVTLTGAQGLAAKPNLTPRLFAEGSGMLFQKACPESFSFKDLGPVKTDGAEPHDGFAVVSSCGSVKQAGGAHSETALIIAIKGNADFYTIQWAERGPDAPQKVDLNDPKWMGRLSKLRPLVVCPIVPGEKPPFPSCANQK